MNEKKEFYGSCLPGRKRHYFGRNIGWAGGMGQPWTYKCLWCGCLVILGNRIKGNHAKHPSNMATLDHVISRNDRNWKRGKRNILVLSCSECNQKRQIKETKLVPIEELWRRSSRHPKRKTNNA